MTLVICKKTTDGNGIIIHSDSRITDEYGTGLESELRQNSPLSGLLKTVIINPHICLSFAGSSSLATDFLKHFYSKPANYWNTPKFLANLLDIHTRSEQGIDFIICSTSQNTPIIYLIKDGELKENLDHAWIGNVDAFNLFQENFLQNSAPPIEERTKTAFEHLLNSNSIQNVGGFHIQAYTDKSAMPNETVFLYELKLEINCGSQVLHLEANEARALPTGTAENGSYGLSYFRSYSPSKHGIAIHFPHGQFGIVFCPQIDCEKGLLIRQVNGQEFANKVFDKYGMPLQGLVVEDTGFRYLNHAS